VSTGSPSAAKAEERSFMTMRLAAYGGSIPDGQLTGMQTLAA